MTRDALTTANDLPVTVLFDRVLVQVSDAEGERRSRSGILIPGEEYVILRERDIHAVASPQDNGGTGQYL